MPRGHRRTAPKVTARLGQTIRELRVERGFAQAELARRIGSSPSHLNKLEAGEKAATVVTLDVIARTLGVPLGELFPPGRSVAAANPPDPLWTRIVAELRQRDHDYLVLVRDMLKVLDRARS